MIRLHLKPCFFIHISKILTPATISANSEIFPQMGRISEPKKLINYFRWHVIKIACLIDIKEEKTVLYMNLVENILS